LDAQESRFVKIEHIGWGPRVSASGGSVVEPFAQHYPRNGLEAPLCRTAKMRAKSGDQASGTVLRSSIRCRLTLASAGLSAPDRGIRHPAAASRPFPGAARAHCGSTF